MVKATLKSAVLLGLIALGVCAASVPSFAEVQNVRVGGDITVRGFFRQNLDLNEGDNGGTPLDDEDFFVQHTTGLNVGADLTENVSAFVRIVNERDWNGGTGTAGAVEQTGDIDISQSHITLKNFFYLPGDVRIGTQPITWGRGFVLGSNLIPSIIGGDGDRNNAISADEFTDLTAFDAARATFDFSGNAAVDLPITLDLVYIKSDENTTGSPDDVNIMGFNVGSKFDSMNGEAELYFLNKRDKSTTGNGKDGSINTMGARGSASPVEGASVYGELAYQFGTIGTDATVTGAGQGSSQQAWAMNFGGDYTFADVQMTPKLGAEWIYFSGKDRDGASVGWDPIARSYFTTAIREFQNVGFYLPDQTCWRATAQGNCTGSATNQHQLSLYGSVKPLEDLSIAPRLSWFILDVGAIATAGGKRNSFAGTELDVITTYNYTDDVQLGLIYGLFLPGNVYRTPTDSTAQELISSVSVKF